VCTVGVPGDGAWKKWRKVVERTCYMATLTREEQVMLWGGTAKEAYKLEG
jgi:L-rhamnono-1,4-lactonase